jgi:hypothetical protein
MRRLAPTASRAAVLSLEGFDITAVDPALQRLCADAMNRLCAALDAPLQLLVRRHRVTSATGAGEPSAGGRVAAALDAAMREHQRAVLAAAPAFANHTYAVVTAAEPGTLARRTDTIIELLGSCGVRASAVQDEVATEGDALSGLAPPRYRAWEERWRWVGGGPAAATTLELARLPGRPVSVGWLGPLLAVATPCDISILLEPVETPAAHRIIERRLRALTADRMLEVDRGRIGDPRVDAGLEAAGALRDRLARNQVRPLRLAITVVAGGCDEHAARRGAELARIAAASAGLRLRPAHLNHAATVRGVAVPSAGSPAGKLVDSAAAATCLPLTETACADPDGYRLGFGRRSGLPVAVDVFDTAHHSNANVAVFATSGHGKSYTLGALILEATVHGAATLVIDPEGEYGHLMAACGGQYLRLGSAACGALNVFDAAATPLEAVAIAVDLVAVLCGGVLTEVERARVDTALRATVRRAQAAGSVPLLGHCITALQQTTPRAAAVLARACAPPLGDIFNRASDIDLAGDLCAVSLRDLPSEFVPAATLLLASWLWARVRGSRRRRHIVLDEVGALCTHPPLRDLLVQLARRCRKHGASLVVATQNVEDLLRTDEGSVVATNCAVVLLGGHRAAEAAQMERAFGLTAAQRRFLEHAGRGEFLLLAGRRRLEVRIDLPDLQRSLLRAHNQSLPTP